MTTTSPSPRPPAEPDALPWPPVLALALATFAMVTGEMLPTAVLPLMAADLGVSHAQVGVLVSGWAAVVVVASFPLVRLVSRWGRRNVIAVTLVVFAVANALTALAPSYEVAAASRFVGAGATGLLWSTVNAHLADVVGEHRLARAVAAMLGGANLGTMLAVPAASASGAVWGWRTAFVALTVLALAAAVLVARTAAGSGSRAPGPRAGRLGRGAGATGHGSGATGHLSGATGHGPGAGRTLRAPGSDREALRRVLTLAAAGGVLLAGHFAAFTFIAPLLEEPARVLPGGVSGLLLVFGLSSGLGVLVVARVGDARPRVALLGAATLTGLALLALPVAGDRLVPAVAVLLLWGLATGALPPLLQTAIMRAAGVRRRALAGTMIPVAFNLGIAVGAALGSALVARAGTGALPVPAALVVLLGAAGLAVASRCRAPEERSGQPEPASSARPSSATNASTSDAAVSHEHIQRTSPAARSQS